VKACPRGLRSAQINCTVPSSRRPPRAVLASSCSPGFHWRVAASAVRLASVTNKSPEVPSRCAEALPPCVYRRLRRAFQYPNPHLPKQSGRNRCGPTGGRRVRAPTLSGVEHEQDRSQSGEPLRYRPALRHRCLSGVAVEPKLSCHDPLSTLLFP